MTVAQHFHRTAPLGFALIEIMVVIAIIGLLLSVIVPGYQQHVLNSYRLEASTELRRLANLQLLLLAEQARYTADLTELGYPTASYLLDSGRYTISAALTADGYQLIAEASGPQLADVNCMTFKLDQYGIKASLPAADCWQ
ncbi:MAG: prepilin-type N-terminal cleavage/methylation domain-containing protein [Gammaproteobacteria bacterium]|nr:prepilin-type N-terminal cleavage/methylation domain-containing protein [Gammaproteobacteria bacterium]MBU2178486.1 prepilin-type N-terminal cleavage/methylation domain-containing protein [Gammaproteobacteria bacterium]MBU2225113.1 prepilin-type N-terminal cleavage/methylation domain-containing protein [Gammaproteobacteria bacterium]MBU2279253.1 prepilin-type N-terminal cleavage/methylation domain-containing protein [Gammaproteobacteria bacterium]MBU2428706.1 prepilin-type N-terminal cleavag